MRKELKIIKVKSGNLLGALGISDKRREQLAEFTAEVIKKSSDKDRGRSGIIADIWGNKKFTDNEVAFMLFAVGGFLEIYEKKSEVETLAGIILKLQ